MGLVDEARSRALALEVYLPEYPLEAIRNVDLVAGALMAKERPEQALSALSLLEAALASEREVGETMTDAERGALEALRAKMPPSGYSRLESR